VRTSILSAAAICSSVRPLAARSSIFSRSSAATLVRLFGPLGIQMLYRYLSHNPEGDDAVEQRRFRVPYWNGHTGARAILLFGDLVLNATICPTRRSTKTLRSCASCRQIATAQNNSPPEPSSSTGCALSSARRFSLAAAASRSATAFASTRSIGIPAPSSATSITTDPL